MARGWALICRGIIFMTPQRFQGRIQSEPAQLKGLNVGDKVKFGFRMGGSVAKS